HTSADIEFVMTTMLTAVKSRLLAIPARTTRLVIGKTDFTEIYSLLYSEIELALRELSEYNPQDFSERNEEYLALMGAMANEQAPAASLSSFRLRKNSLVSGAEAEIFRATSLHFSPGGRLGEKRKQLQLGKQRVELWWDLSQQALGVLSCDFQSTDPDRL